MPLSLLVCTSLSWRGLPSDPSEVTSSCWIRSIHWLSFLTRLPQCDPKFFQYFILLPQTSPFYHLCQQKVDLILFHLQCLALCLPGSQTFAPICGTPCLNEASLTWNLVPYVAENVFYYLPEPCARFLFFTFLSLGVFSYTLKLIQQHFPIPILYEVWCLSWLQYPYPLITFCKKPNLLQFM